MKLIGVLRPLRIALLAIAVVVTFMGLVVTYENWHAPRALAAERDRLLANGEPMDFKSLLQPALS